MLHAKKSSANGKIVKVIKLDGMPILDKSDLYAMNEKTIGGQITNLIPIEKDDRFFGDNSLWMVELKTNKSPLYFLLVGESEIQDFNFCKEKYDNSIICNKLTAFYKEI